MKKNLLNSVAVAAMSLLALACAKEQVTGDGQTVEATFEVDVPGTVATKAIGDGMTATKLYYQVFDAGSNPIEGLGVQNTTLSSGKASVSFQLVKDQTYNFVFWAQTPEDGYYTIDQTDGLKKISANYTDKKANDENFDAFYAVEKLTVNGPVSKDVTLKRPFAQINIATEGKISAGTTVKDLDFTDATSTVTVKKIPTVFSPLDANDVTTTKTVTFAVSKIPDGDITVDGKDYKYLSMNYVFAPADRSIYDITAEITVAGQKVPISIPGAPLQRNYRTNVVGNLLVTGADFNVVITPGFDGDEDLDLVNIKSAAAFKAALANGGKLNVVGDVTATDRFFSITKDNTEIEVAAGATIAGEFSDNTYKVLSFYYKGGKLLGEGTIVGPKTNYDICTAAIDNESGEEVIIDGKLTVKGAAGTKSGCVDAAIVLRNGKVTINGGHFVSEDDVDGKGNPCVYLLPNDRDGKYRAELVINGGTFECNGPATYVINMDDKYRDRCSVKIYGGKFKGFDPANVNEGTITSFVPDGYKSTLVGEYYVVTKEDVTPVADQAGLETALSTIEANKTETISLPAGDFATYSMNNLKNKGLTLTFEGNGAENTTFYVGKDLGVSGEGNSDYSLEGNDVIFKNLTVSTDGKKNMNYQGFVRCKNITFENCSIYGMLSYLGTGKVVFKNCKFPTNGTEYKIWTYSGLEYVFEGCEFDCSLGKCINVYREQSTAPYKITIKDCKFKSNLAMGKCALELKTDTNKYEVYFEGNNVCENFLVSKVTDSSLYNSNSETSSIVYINGTKVWENGAKVE